MVLIARLFMNEEWKKKNSSFPPHFQRTTETPNKKKKKKKMSEQVFVTTSDAKTIKAISVDLETFAVSDVLSSLMGDSDDGRNLEGINLRSTRTGQMFPISFSIYEMVSAISFLFVISHEAILNPLMPISINISDDSSSKGVERNSI